jgi:hypothetical protein
MVVPVPRRYWRSYGDDPLPTGQEALGEPLAAFPSWFLRLKCDRCGKVQMVNKACTMGEGDPQHPSARQTPAQNGISTLAVCNAVQFR